MRNGIYGNCPSVVEKQQDVLIRNAVIKCANRQPSRITGARSTSCAKNIKYGHHTSFTVRGPLRILVVHSLYKMAHLSKRQILLTESFTMEARYVG